MSKRQAEKSPADADIPKELGIAAPGYRQANAHDLVHLLGGFLEQHEAAAELKVCERTLDRWRRLGEGPPITKVGRRVLYRRSSLQAWLHGREHHGRGDKHSAEQSSMRKCGVLT